MTKVHLLGANRSYDRDIQTVSVNQIVFFFAVFAAVNLFFLICQYKDMRKFLLDRCDAAWIFTFKYIFNFLW